MSRLKKMLLCFMLLLGLLCVGSFTLSAADEEVASGDWGAFRVTVEPRTEVAPGKEVTFDVTITNMREKISVAEIYKWYYREKYNSETYPGKDFGDLTDDSGRLIEAGSSLNFRPDEPVALILTGTIPDTWNEQSEILVVMNDPANDYHGQGACPSEEWDDSDDDTDDSDDSISPSTPAPAPAPVPSVTPAPQTPAVPAMGTSLEDKKSNGSYKVSAAETSGTVTVQYVTPVNKNASSVTIPDTVTVNGVTCKVTSISPNAFKNNKKIKKVKIGKNIEKIGANTFNGCKNLKKIVIKSTKLNAKKIGAKAFAKINSKATIVVPKKLLKTYQKILRKKGLSSSVKITK